LDTVVLLVVASQMMKGQVPQIFFLEPPLLDKFHSYCVNRSVIQLLSPDDDSIY